MLLHQDSHLHIRRHHQKGHYRPDFRDSSRTLPIQRLQSAHPCTWRHGQGWLGYVCRSWANWLVHVNAQHISNKTSSHSRISELPFHHVQYQCFTGTPSRWSHPGCNVSWRLLHFRDRYCQARCGCLPAATTHTFGLCRLAKNILLF